MNHRNQPLPTDPTRVESFYVGDWLVQPSLNRISGPGEPVQIEPRVMHVLTCLASVPGEVISRQDLLDVVWSGIVVNETAVTQAISLLRNVFGDDSKSPRFIETIHKGGYRLIAPVRQEREEAPPASAGAEGESSPVRAAGRPARSRAAAAISVIAVVTVVILAVWISRSRSTFTPPPAALMGTPFTSYLGREILPAISPDGARVAFSWNGGEGSEYDLYVKQRNTESPLRLSDTEGDEYYVAWSPDGTTLAFAYESEDGVGIYTLPAIGGTLRKVVDAPHGVVGLDWSPDGKWLVYSSSEEARSAWQVYLYSFATRRARPLTTLPEKYLGDVYPAFSPDAQSVAFVRVDRGTLHDIYVVSIEGGEPRRLTYGQHRVEGLDWTADGKHLVFASSPTPRSEPRLWRLRLEDGALAWLPAKGRGATRPSVANRGHGLVYEEESICCNIMRTPVGETVDAEAEAHCLIASTLNDYWPLYSPSGNRVLFISTRTGDPEIWICDGEGQNAKQLTEFRGAYVEDPCWSYDGRFIAFSAAPGNFFSIYVADVETGEIRRIFASDHHEICLGWSWDSEWVYGKSERSTGWQVWKMRPDGSETIPLMEKDVLKFVEAPDGQHFYYSRADSFGIWQVPIGGSVEDGVPVEASGPVACSSWRVMENGLYFFTYNRPGADLWFRDSSTGDASYIMAVPPFYGFNLDVSPDVKWLLYGDAGDIGSDLTLVEGFQ